MKTQTIKKINFTNAEQWKYTNPKKFTSCTFDFIPNNKTLNIKCNDNELIIHNGIIYLKGDIFKQNNILLNNLNKDSSQIQRGISLKIPKNTIIEKPIKIKHIIDNGDRNSFFNYKNFIEVGKNSSVTLINEELFPITHCINITFEVSINDGANLDIINHSEKPDTKQLLNFSANLSRNSKLNIHSIDIKGKLIKNNYFIYLNKEGSECSFNGFNLIDKKDHIDNYVEIYHNSKHTISNLNYKSITSGSSTSILFAKAIIAKHSSDSQAYQKNNNLMLSPKSTIHSNPQLEIYNNDVQCSHGSTTGALDEDQIFYMRTRGISKEEAKKILISSFLNETIDRIDFSNIKNYFFKKIDNYLLNVS